MTFVLTHRLPVVATTPRRTARTSPGLAVSRRLGDRLRRLGAALHRTAEQRAAAYVSRMPTAVLAG